MTTHDNDDILSPGDRLPRFRRSYETYRLVELLSELHPGEAYTYRQLSEAMGMEIVGITPSFQSAKRLVFREYGVVLETMYGEGVRRLTDEEIVENSRRGTLTVSRRASQESKRLAQVDFASLSEEQRRTYTTHQSILGAIQAISSARGIATVRNNVIGEMRQLPIKETLDLFREE